MTAGLRATGVIATLLLVPPITDRSSATSAAPAFDPATQDLPRVDARYPMRYEDVFFLSAGQRRNGTM